MKAVHNLVKTEAKPEKVTMPKPKKEMELPKLNTKKTISRQVIKDSKVKIKLHKPESYMEAERSAFFK
jgi:hypothetical protein